MNGKRTPGRSLDEWLELVTSCRQSGLTDAAWCHENGISPSCFYNAVSRLRKRACEIPEPSGKASTLDFTSHKQDVVRIAIEPEHTPAELVIGGFIMNGKRTPGRSPDEWLELVTSCRQSGLTDAAWCHENGISPSCFYNAVSRLRKRACEIPEPAGKASTLDFTSHKQDVVRIAIEPEHTPAELVSMEKNRSLYFDNSHTIEIEANGLRIRISNDIQPVLLKTLMAVLRESTC